MLTIHPSNQLPRTQVREIRRSWDDRLFSWTPFQPTTIKKVPFVLKINNAIYIHPDLLNAVRKYLEAHNLAYKCGEFVFEPKNQATMWELR